MKKQPVSGPATSSTATKPKKAYHAPRLREYGSLVKLTAKGTMGGDTGAKSFP